MEYQKAEVEAMSEHNNDCQTCDERKHPEELYRTGTAEDLRNGLLRLAEDIELNYIEDTAAAAEFCRKVAEVIEPPTKPRPVFRLDESSMESVEALRARGVRVDIVKVDGKTLYIPNIPAVEPIPRAPKGEK